MWDIYDLGTHRRGENDIPVSLLLENSPRRLRRVERPVQVHVDDIAPLVSLVILGGDVGGDARIGDDDVELPKVGSDALDYMFDVRLVRDVGLIGCRADVVGRRDLGGDGVGVFGGIVDQGDLPISIRVRLRGQQGNRRTLAPASASALVTSSPMPRAAPGRSAEDYKP